DATHALSSADTAHTATQPTAAPLPSGAPHPRSESPLPPPQSTSTASRAMPPHVTQPQLAYHTHASPISPTRRPTYPPLIMPINATSSSLPTRCSSPTYS